MEFSIAQHKLDMYHALTQKRQDNGFYEQKLIREQVALLAGQYADDEIQYRALMDNAAEIGSEIFV